jgi:hypothetical protein
MGYRLSWVISAVPDLAGLQCPCFESGHLPPEAMTPDTAYVSALPLVGPVMNDPG